MPADVDYTLELPSHPAFLTTARLFAAAITRDECTEEAVENLKLAVTEAASALLSHQSDQPVTVSCIRREDHFEFMVSRPGVTELDPVPAERPLRGLALAGEMVPSLTVHPGDPLAIEIAINTA